MIDSFKNDSRINLPLLVLTAVRLCPTAGMQSKCILKAAHISITVIALIWCSSFADGMRLTTEYIVDETKRGREFLGYGVNPSAGTYRLLHDYPEPQRSELLDFMFTPSFGASFHRIKVEIGGDGQGTDGSEVVLARCCCLLRCMMVD